MEKKDVVGLLIVIQILALALLVPTLYATKNFFGVFLWWLFVTVCSLITLKLIYKYFDVLYRWVDDN